MTYKDEEDQHDDDQLVPPRPPSKGSSGFLGRQHIFHRNLPLLSKCPQGGKIRIIAGHLAQHRVKPDGFG